MLKIGLTGGIGSGKSLICRIFSILGAPVYDADHEAKRIMREDARLKGQLSEAFGPDVIKEDGPDRRLLAGIIFNDPGALKLINSLVHPAVLHDFKSWLKKHGDAPYIIKEAAIIFESAMHKYLDTVILITAPEELRMNRVLLRGTEGEKSIKQRMANQWPDEKKIPLAGLVLVNDNISPVLPVILRLHSEFSNGHLPGEMKK